MSGASNTFNYGQLVLKENRDDGPGKTTIGIKFSEFDDGLEFEEKEDTANIGGATTTIGYDRTGAPTNPTFTDALRWNEGLEHILYGLFGGQRVGTEISGTGLYEYRLSNNGNYEELPLFTILKGFNMWNIMGPDGEEPITPELFDNAQVNEVELKLSTDDTLSVSVTFVSDAPLSGVADADPTLVYKAKSSKIVKDHIKILMGDTDLTLEELRSASCIKELTIKLSNNLEVSSCFGDKFGVNSSDSTDFTGEISATSELNRTNFLTRRKHLTGKSDGVRVSQEIYEQQIAVLVDGPFVLDSDNKPTSDRYGLLVHFPVINVTKAKPSQSGNDAGTFELEAKMLPDMLGGSPVIVEMKTNLEEIPYATQHYTVID